MDNFTDNTNTSINKPVILTAYQDKMDSIFYIPILSISVLMILCNGLTIVVLIKRSPLPPQTTRILLSLTVADLLVGGCYMWGKISMRLCNDNNSKNVFCAFFPIIYIQLDYACILCAVSNTLLVAIDRYMAIFEALRYHQILSSARVKKMLVLAWAFPIMYSFTFYCWLLSSTGTVPLLYQYTFSFGCYFLVGIFLLYTYTRIYLTAKRHRNRIHQQDTAMNRSGGTIDTKASEHKTSKTSNMLIYMMISYILAWTPYITLTLIILVDVSDRSNSILTLISNIAELIGYANSGWNILIYIVKHQAMRKAYRDTFCSWSCTVPPIQ